MTKLKKTDSHDPDFVTLVKSLDKELAVRDGDEHAFYAQFNKIDAIKHAIVAYIDNVAVGCGAIKPIDKDKMEVKRMYVLPENRGLGVASSVLEKLELWAKEMHCKSCVLETGQKQPEAIQLYLKAGYIIIPNYGQYIGVDNSICFEKEL